MLAHARQRCGGMGAAASLGNARDAAAPARRRVLQRVLERQAGADEAMWRRAFAEHLELLVDGERPLRKVDTVPSAAHAFRAALQVLRADAGARDKAAAFAFAAELVAALRKGDPQIRACVLGRLDGNALSQSECADIGLAALWQLAARALDVLCLTKIDCVTSAACACVFAFLADTPDTGPCALPRIVERYASPALVVSSLLRIVEDAVDHSVSIDALVNPATTTVARPAAVLANAVSVLASSISPRALAAIAPGPRATPSPTSVLAPLRPSLQPSRAKLRAASDALCLLLALVLSDMPSYREALLSLRDTAQSTAPTSFRGVYTILCYWAPHPAGSLLAETLLSGNRKFRAYTLSRTDPEAFLLPLLRSLHERCAPPAPAADAYASAAVLLTLSSDPGFCEAIDAITIAPSSLTWADPRGRIANATPPSLSAVVHFVGARAVQQSLLAKRSPPQTYTASLILAAMANVSVSTTSIHAPTADRLVSLLDFMGRRVRRLSSQCHHHSADSSSTPTETPTPTPSTNHNHAQCSDGDLAEFMLGGDIEAVATGREQNIDDLRDALIALTGLALELTTGVLRSRSDVSSNRHLVYALLHRDHLVRRDGTLASLSPRCGAICARLERLVRYFGAHVDRIQPAATADYPPLSLSVERVFAVIDDTARVLPKQIFAGLPALRFEYRTVHSHRRLTFLRYTVWHIVRRFAPHVAHPDHLPPSNIADALYVPPPT